MRRSLAERRERTLFLWRFLRRGRERAVWLVATLAAVVLVLVGLGVTLLWPRTPAAPSLATRVETAVVSTRERAERMELRLRVAEIEGEIRSNRAPERVRAALDRLRDRVGSVLPELDPSLTEDAAEAVIDEVARRLATDPDGAADALARLGERLGPPVALPVVDDGDAPPSGAADPDAAEPGAEPATDPAAGPDADPADPAAPAAPAAPSEEPADDG